MINQLLLVEEGLATAVWHLDQPLLESLVRGILSQRMIIGVSIYSETGELMASASSTEIADTLGEFKEHATVQDRADED